MLHTSINKRCLEEAQSKGRIFTLELIGRVRKVEQRKDGQRSEHNVPSSASVDLGIQARRKEKQAHEEAGEAGQRVKGSNRGPRRCQSERLIRGRQVAARKYTRHS